ADPPVEHKAYLHRSGRTARAGESGTVITVQTPDQKRDVSDLMRKAGITPTYHSQVQPTSPVLSSLAPGERVATHEPRQPEPELDQARMNGERRGRSGGQGRGGQGGGQGRGGQGGGARRGGQGEETRTEGQGRGGQGRRGQGAGGQGRGGQGGGGQGGGRRGGQGGQGGSASGARRQGQGAPSRYSTSSDGGGTGNSVGGGLASFSSGRKR
ncbi:MAG: DEAD/DEAH box helicase, partial [Brachybacterium sp.]